MKIWVIGRNYPLSKNQLQGSFELEQAKMLARYGHEVTYFALVFHPFRNVKRWGNDFWQQDGVKICIHCARCLPARFGIQYTPYRIKKWKSFLNNENNGTLPDIIHVHYPSMICNPDVLEEYRQKGVKIVCTEHWSKVLLRKLFSHESARLNWHMDNADDVAAVGHPLAESMQAISRSSRRVNIIPNIINPIFAPVTEKKNDGVFRFITVGRLVSLRQYDKIIFAFDKLYHGRTDVTLTLIGGGQEYKKLKKLIKRLNAQNNIFLAGTKSREECAAAVASSDCLICYSKYETFGVPIIEAWACGIPVITPRHLGFLESDAGRRLGIAVDSADTESLCKAMDEIMDKQNSFEPEYISAYAANHFSEKAVYEKILSMYNNTLK